MKTKYRIVKNEHHYAIQEKVYFFFWRIVNLGSKSYRHNAYFKNLEDAEKGLQSLIDVEVEERKRKSKYRVVNTKVVSDLYRTMKGD